MSDTIWTKMDSLTETLTKTARGAELGWTATCAECGRVYEQAEDGSLPRLCMADDCPSCNWLEPERLAAHQQDDPHCTCNDCIACLEAEQNAHGGTLNWKVGATPATPDHGTEDDCPKNATGHEPDWHSASLTIDGGETYLDLACRHCGRSGCLGTISELADNLQW